MDKLADNKLCGDAECSCKSEQERVVMQYSTMCLMCCQRYILFTIFHSSFASCALLDVLSMATALDDFVALDCRFINIKKGQTVYVYSKLVPEEGSGVFWSGSVCARINDDNQA